MLVCLTPRGSSDSSHNFSLSLALFHIEVLVAKLVRVAGDVGILGRHLAPAWLVIGVCFSVDNVVQVEGPSRCRFFGIVG